MNIQKIISSKQDRKDIASLAIEINKENYSLEMQKEIEKELSSALKNVKNSENSFKKVVEDSKKESEQKSLKSSRSRRNLDGVALEEETNRSLNFEERKSVSTFYKEFSNLKERSQDFNRQLKEIEQEKKPTKKEVLNPGQEALNSLEQIGWNKNRNIDFQKFVSRHWWDSGNPYAQIIDFEEWEALKRVYQGADLMIKAVKENSTNRACSVSIGILFSISDSFCYKAAQDPERIKKAIEKSIPLKVLEKLLKDMNLIPNLQKDS